MKTKRGRPHGTYKLLHPSRVNGKVTAVYACWQSIKDRCLNPKSQHWKWYGARGISVCERWSGKDGFNNFIEDMGVPLPGMTIDRKDNNSGYFKENCWWATKKEQARNRRKRERMAGSLAWKANQVGLKYSVVYTRVKLLGWDEEKALSTPVYELGKYPRIRMPEHEHTIHL